MLTKYKRNVYEITQLLGLILIKKQKQYYNNTSIYNQETSKLKSENEI